MNDGNYWQYRLNNGIGKIGLIRKRGEHGALGVEKKKTTANIVRAIEGSLWV